MALGDTIREITADPAMPCWDTIHRHLRDDPAFSAQYTRAREEQADNHAEEVLTVARGLSGLDANGIAAGRILVDSLKWRAGRMAPKRWGDRTSHEVSGPDGGPISLDSRNTVAEKIRSLAERLRDDSGQAP